MKNGAERLCDALEALGVECVFGVPGTQNVALYEALRRSRIRSVVATHELAASFMANGYHRASGKVAPLVTIPGPGFTYALTGLAEALHDSAAVVHITGQPPHGRAGACPPTEKRGFHFQALDQRAIAAPLVKGVCSIDQADDVAAGMARAFDLALTGEPGPVLVEVAGRALEDVPARDAERARRQAPPALDAVAVDGAAALLGASRRPLIMAGQGCAEAAGLLRELAELLRAPVFTTMSGRGVLPDDHALALGFEFVRGNVSALNELIGQSDCVLAVGCKLTSGGTAGFELALPADRLIHVDASADVLGATYQARLAIVGPAALFLERLVPAVKRSRVASTGGFTPGEVEGWRKRLRATASGAVPEPTVKGITPATAAAFFAALRRALPRDGIVVTDSGLHQLLARRHLDVLSPRGLIAPSDFQSMGFGLPAAIGAKLAAPDRPVVVVLGDGGFAMSGMELLTAAREGVPLTVIVFNDGRLNLIRVAQLARFGQSEGVDLLNPDFAAFAAAVGVRYARCEGDVERVLRSAVRGAQPVLLEVLVGDSPAIHVARAKALVRGTARRAIGPGAISWLRRRLQRR